MTQLPDDISRCHDNECPERESCQRWLQRHMGGERVVNSTSLYPFPYNQWDCPYKIEEEKKSMWRVIIPK